MRDVLTAGPLGERSLLTPTQQRLRFAPHCRVQGPCARELPNFPDFASSAAIPASNHKITASGKLNSPRRRANPEAIRLAAPAKQCLRPFNVPNQPQVADP